MYLNGAAPVRRVAATPARVRVRQATAPRVQIGSTGCYHGTPSYSGGAYYITDIIKAMPTVADTDGEEVVAKIAASTPSPTRRRHRAGIRGFRVMVRPPPFRATPTEAARWAGV